jgi:hypothetical protein
MASQSEKSFGARLRKFQDAVQYAQNWEGYNPPRPQESIAELTQLVEKVITENQNETTSFAGYSEAVLTRKYLFTTRPGSIDKILVNIRGAVVAQYGKRTPQEKAIAALITTMRKTGIIKPPADPANPDAAKGVSQSEQSFGSKTQYFSDIVTTIATMADYTTSNPDLALSALQARVQQLHNANNAVADHLQLLRNSRTLRTANYNDLADRMTRMKAYTKSQYGIRSAEYKALMSLGI